MVRVLLKFSEKIIDQPITSQVILEQGQPINILSAHIDPRGGEILVDIPTREADKMIKAFREKGVTVVTQKLIRVDQEGCIDCGACLSLCPMTAISFREDHTIFFDEEKCIGVTCSTCVDACPERAIKLIV
jgi:MinD superfamily P-loop ATPase